jgi:hypothetical protein
MTFLSKRVIACAATVVMVLSLGNAVRAGVITVTGGIDYYVRSGTGVGSGTKTASAYSLDMTSISNSTSVSTPQIQTHGAANYRSEYKFTVSENTAYTIELTGSAIYTPFPGVTDAQVYVQLWSGGTIIPTTIFRSPSINVSNAGFTGYTGQLIAGQEYILQLGANTGTNYGLAPADANGRLVLTIPGAPANATVPEPASIAVWGSFGLVGLVVGWRKRRAR